MIGSFAMFRQRKVIQFISLLVSLQIIILGLLSACNSLPTPTVTSIISRDKAIEIAINGCKTPHLVLVGEPKNIHTKLITLEEADKLTSREGETRNYGIPLDTKVWLVQMDGALQLVGGPLPAVTEDSQEVTPTPAQPFYGTCSVIIDANSGTVILVRG
jgi:hypothetical protein